jgi:RNA polymerase sigma-70 factor (ECF subfamily)
MAAMDDRRGEFAESGGWDSQRHRFSEIFSRSEAALMRAALRLCRGGHDCAQELVQDAVVRAYVAFRKGLFREGANAQAWLLRIMTNAFINEYRRKSRWEAGVDVDTLTAGGETGPEATRAAPGDRPEAALLESTFDEPLEAALSRLPEALRKTILLVDVDGNSYDEAAKRLGVPVGTIRSRLARARYQLQDLLRDYGRERRLS